MSYNQFTILNVIPEYSNKRIVINTNFRVDPTSINTNTVMLFGAEIGSKTEYTLSVDKKDIIISFEDYPKFDKYYLKIEKIKDALQRELSYFYSDFVYFTSNVKDELTIMSPMHQETLSSSTVKFLIRSNDGIREDYEYLLEISDTISFTHNVCKFDASGVSMLDREPDSNLIEFTVEIPYDGQVFARARAQRDEEVFGEWSEPISFNISIHSIESIDTNYMEYYLNTNDLFDDFTLNEIVPLEVIDKSPITELHDKLYIEFNKDIHIPKNDDEDSMYTKLGTAMVFKKDLDNKGSKEKIKANLLVDPDDPSTLLIKPIGVELLGNCQYTVVIKDLKFEDGTTHSNKEVFYTKPNDLYVSIDDVKQLVGGLVPDESILKNIVEAGKVAKYWAKKNVDHPSQIPDFSKEGFEEDYYPFYKFIEHTAAAHALKEVYIEMISNPKKWRDVLSDLQREEEWDFDAMKRMIDDLEHEAEEWLQLVITITADPKWALRGRHFYAAFYPRSSAYHNTGWNTPRHNNFDRGY